MKGRCNSCVQNVSVDVSVCVCVWPDFVCGLCCGGLDLCMCACRVG